MKVAVIGAGVAGLTVASLLHPRHGVTVFESQDRLGGHANTVTARHEGRDMPVDTGFIVYNERNYPAFTAMLRRLGVPTRPAPMTFSVRCDRTGLEYGGTLAGLLAQPTNLLRPGYWRMLAGIARLGRVGRRLLVEAPAEMTIGDLCRSGRFSAEFLDYYLVPMASAIWSAPRDGLMDFPARFFLAFFDQHGMLDLRERPQWRTITGGSREYVARLAVPFADRCRVGCAVRAIRRGTDGVEIASAAGAERFDEVVLACHADEALAMLADATPAEREVLSAMPFQASDTVLHTDAGVLPRRRRAWAGWNYRLPDGPGRKGGAESGSGAPPVVTYNLTMLQSLATRTPLCVTLNDTGRIAPGARLARLTYHHPQYTLAGVAARARWREISGRHARTHYCGAYWFNGFHEDGVQSALRVAADLGAPA